MANETPKTISQGTMIMLGAAILFIIIAIVLITIFFNAPTGGSGSNSANMKTNVGP